MLEWQITIDSSRGRETNAEIINYTYLQNKHLIYNLNKVIKRIMSNYKPIILFTVKIISYFIAL